MRNSIPTLALLLLTLSLAPVHGQDGPGVSGGIIPKGAQDTLSPWQNFARDEWRGLTADGSLNLPGSATLSLPHPNNWTEAYGLRLDLVLPERRLFEGEVIVSTPPVEAKTSYRSTNSTSFARFSIVGHGKETIDLPLTAFDHFSPFTVTFKAIKDIGIRGKFSDGKPGTIKLNRVRLIQSPTIKLYSSSRSKAAEKNATVDYDLQVMNCSDRAQTVILSHHQYSKHVMKAVISPNTVYLEPGETKPCKVTVNVTDRVPPGGRERQKIIAVANGQYGGAIEFITGCKLPHPYLVHTPERWQEIRDKVKNYPWAREALKRYTGHNPANGDRPGSNWPLGVAWQITRDRSFAQRAKRAVRVDVGGKDLIQAAELYDMIQDSGVFSEEEEQRIETAFRERMKSISLSGVANLELQEARCGFTLALAVQDFAWFDYFLYASDGVYDNIANGIMPDGWWYEGSVNYNVWVSRYICKMALAAEPFGVNLIDHHFTPGYSKEFRQLTESVETRKREFGGKPFQKFGKHPKPYITLDMLWDSFIDHIAYDGHMFAANDGGEWSFTSDEAFELAYMMWPKPEYATLVKRRGDGGRSLLYGVPELPENAPQLGLRSAYSDGIGFITLRSQTPGRHPSEQIDATLKYGTHGAYHGHFDRTGFNSLRRYDRSFYSSGHGLWYSYASFMYGMFVQSSINHNMVVVDSKNQEAVESSRLLFHSGRKMQAAAVESNARWSNPPYLGLQMRRPNRKEGESLTFTGRERLQQEDVYMPAPEGEEPRVASIGEFGERVLQRRLMVVTDDYLVLADYLKGNQEHTYDNLLQIRGFQNITGDNLRPARHTDQMGNNPLLADQLITDCQWYDKDGTSKAEFLTIYDDRAHLNWRSLKGKKGSLYMDVYSAWPKQAEIMIGQAPEVRERAGWTRYTIKADERLLAEDEFSPWILGRADLDLEIKPGTKTLTLRTQNEDRRKGGGFILGRKDNLFWAGGVLETVDGRFIKLGDLEKSGRLTYQGIRTTAEGDQPVTSGRDYHGGDIVIAGRPYGETLPAQPKGEGLITIDVSTLKPKRLKISLGADYPQGDVRKYQRKTYSARTTGKSARFLTVIEPFENKGESKVKEVIALSADRLQVKLKSGSTQEIQISGLEESDNQLQVTLKERGPNGELRHEETTE